MNWKYVVEKRSNKENILASFADPNDSRVILGPIAVKASAKRVSLNDLHGCDDCENCDGGVDDGG